MDHNSSIVGIGTTFLDNVYQVASVSVEEVLMVKSFVMLKMVLTLEVYQPQVSIMPGAGFTGGVDAAGVTTSLGRLSWGRLYNGVRSSNPISIGVTGLTVNTGLTTFPTIQRKNYDPTSHRGLRSTGAIRVFGL